MAFSSRANSSSRPRRCRSSGMCAMPRSRRALRVEPAERPPVERQSRRTRATDRPARRSLRPARAARCLRRRRCRRSRRLARRTSHLSVGRARARLPKPLPTSRPRDCARSARPRRACAGAFSTRSSTSRPTISRASSAALVSFVLTRPTTFPSRITVTSSEIASTSASLCVMMTIVFPCSRMPRRIAKNSSTSCGVSTAVGSSRISSRALR